MATIEINETEIKKDLMRSKAMAKFSHYIAGNLYYKVEIMGDLYVFPIETVEEVIETDSFEREEIQTLKLSSDLGTTKFESEIRGSELARWISKSINNLTFIKL
jgi:hypothetical protein